MSDAYDWSAYLTKRGWVPIKFSTFDGELTVWMDPLNKPNVELELDAAQEQTKRDAASQSPKTPIA